VGENGGSCEVHGGLICFTEWGSRVGRKREMGGKMKTLKYEKKIIALNRRRRVFEEMLKASREFQTDREELSTSIDDYQMNLFSLLGVGKRRGKRERARV
jgi:hypothetical protein